MISPKKKMDILNKSFEKGIIDKEEFEKSKKDIEPKIEEFENKTSESNKTDAAQDDPHRSSDKALIFTVVAIVLLLIAIISFGIFYKSQPKTLEDLHVLNLKGKLKPEQGYIYKKVYSFVTLDNEWYTQLNSPKGTKIYSLALRYSPRDLKDITIDGQLNNEFFNNQTEFYVTFNPTGKEFSYVGLAVADFNTHMSKVFEKIPIAACDRNETEACKTRPIVTCDNTDKLVLYVKESDKFRVYYNNNCIIVEGKGFDLVKGVDRILYNFYHIMEQEEV